MTPEALDIVMRRLDMLQTDIATIMGVTPRQVNSWRRGVNAIPRSVALILAALDNKQLNLEWVVSFVEMEMKREADK